VKLKIPIHFIAATALLTGCAFDVTHVKQLPVAFASNTENTEIFILNHDVKATLGTGFATRLKAGTRWQQDGNTEYGKVFATKDQIVTVEASNTYEAELVVSNQYITGFYLIVEKTFAPVTRPIHIEIQTSNLNSNKSQ
jgi:hypothetical protein